MALSSEERLREKLRKIEALYAGAATAGEKTAAGAAAERIRRQFEAISRTEQAEEFKFSITDPWSRQLFIALCRRYGMKPFRYPRMHRQTVMVRAPASFVHVTLWPEFEELSRALTSHLDDITRKIIREEVHEATQDADEINEPRQLR
ncbi:hypothetical protein RAH32_16705 [Paracoccus sp. WLY502]|uniref:hypothetical protein n=1 Tax=Paracoccus yibinensis TaxID=3068891 RepID=UPI0027966765|nr:hypothetical protein [Paracoccus sp. WLY502]MDQ1902072.1 hypothetical protein [Paracoccus sp. WLY502]